MIGDFLAARGWLVQDFQRRAWAAQARGESGLIHAPTGTGKTLAAWGGAVNHHGKDIPPPLSYLWITPLKALAADSCASLNRPLEWLNADWRMHLRTGDTSTATRQRLDRQPPAGLVTTPESLSLMLSHARQEARLNRLDTVYVDEWHELLGSKRGVLLQLALSRLRALNPSLKIWGLSATLGNVDQAMAVLLGPGRSGCLIAGDIARPVSVETLMPTEVERFPWAGRVGLSQLQGLVAAIAEHEATLVFTNTRSQAERWHQALQSVAPWPERVALHHGSLAAAQRAEVEQGLSDGRLRCVVATSSLDLGVDFSPVDQVVQIGSPKGIARLIQRAGRAGHRPGQGCRVLCVPTHALEIIEIAAARRQVAAGRVETREPIRLALDVAAQYLVTRALGSGFQAGQALAELRDTDAYARLDNCQWQWLLEFITRGGTALSAYPRFRRVVRVGDWYRVTDRRVARLHRMSVGTISADGTMTVKRQRGGVLGHIEERFINRLKPGEAFLFAGHRLEVVRVRDLTVYVRNAGGSKASVPRWAGSRMPLSTLLADAMLALLEQAETDQAGLPEELIALKPLLDIQQDRSGLPRRDRLLVEQLTSREGHHLFLYPFAGRLAHEGLAPLLAWRLARQAPASFSLTVNDYGIELVGDKPVLINPASLGSLLSTRNLLEDLLASLNASAMARQRFRDIARIAGLVFTGYPGRSRQLRQIQASSALMFDMLSEHDPANLLLDQARREVLEAELDFVRLENALKRLSECRICIRRIERLSPLAFPLWADRLRSQLSSESWDRRLARMLDSLEPRRRAG